jgi:hypothetical protein
MKKALWLMLLLGFSWVPHMVSGQSFQDLNFNSANVSSPDYLQRVPFANAFPSWSSSSSMAYYNASDMDQMTIGVYDKNAGLYSWGPHPILGLSGYTAYLEADLGSFLSGSVGISQTGVIPVNVQSIRFYSTIAYASALPGYSPTLSLTLNGTPVPYYQIGTSGAFTQWAADVSAYAGTATALGFEVSATYPYPYGSPNPHWIFGVGIDNISFSTTPVPEPTTVTFFILGLLFPVSKLIRKSIS